MIISTLFFKNTPLPFFNNNNIPSQLQFSNNNQSQPSHNTQSSNNNQTQTLNNNSSNGPYLNPYSPYMNAPYNMFLYPPMYPSPYMYPNNYDSEKQKRPQKSPELNDKENTTEQPIIKPEVPKPVGPIKPDYSSMTTEQQEKYWAKFRRNFGVLRREYPHFNIPDPDTLGNLETIHDYHEEFIKQIHVDNNVDNYKFYLIIIWASVELFCKYILGLDISGYTENQIDLMFKYERLLNELGEKSYGGIGQAWPIEIRIIMLALFNAVIFIVLKIVVSYLPEGLGDMVKGFAKNLMRGNRERRERYRLQTIIIMSQMQMKYRIPLKEIQADLVVF